MTEFPKWVPVHESHIVRGEKHVPHSDFSFIVGAEPKESISVPGYETHISRDGTVTALVENAAAELALTAASIVADVAEVVKED